MLRCRWNMSYKISGICPISTIPELSYKDLNFGVCPILNSGISLPGPTPNLNITSKKIDYVIIG